MNSASTSNENDMKKDLQERLQIDTDLANSTREMKFEVVVEKADSLLRTSDIEEFANKTFKDLTKDQQAVMMLMVTKILHRCNPERCPKVLVGALKPETDKYNAMMSFVRKGEDRSSRSDKTLLDQFNHTHNEFTRDFSEQEDGITIFDVQKGMEPLLYTQQDNPYICTFNACSALLYYHSYDIGSPSSQSSFRANLSRFFRDEIDELKVANLTLTTQKGPYLDEVLTGLMKSFGTSESWRFPERINMDKNDEDYNYNQLYRCLQKGRPIAITMENFPTLSDFTIKHFSGKLSNHNRNSERPGPEDRTYHAVACIGIKPRRDHRPPMLLIQDSCEQRPAFSIGLDLLMDMEIEEELQFCALPKDWKLNPDQRYKVTKESQDCFAGSPMNIDEKDKLYIVPKPRRDMSRYLERVDPRDVDGIVVYYGGL